MAKLVSSQSMSASGMSDGGYLTDSENESNRTLDELGKGHDAKLPSLHTRTLSLERNEFINDQGWRPATSLPCLIIHVWMELMVIIMAHHIAS